MVNELQETIHDPYFYIFNYIDVITKNPFSIQSVDYTKTIYKHYVYRVENMYYKINNTVDIMSIIEKQDLKDIL